MSSPKPPKPTESQLQAEAANLQASALLDQQENERRKRLLNAAAGLRAFSGSALGRAAPSNTAAPGGPSASQQSSQASRALVMPNGGGSAAGGGGGARGSFVKPV